MEAGILPEIWYNLLGRIPPVTSLVFIDLTGYFILPCSFIQIMRRHYSFMEINLCLQPGNILYYNTFGQDLVKLLHSWDTESLHIILSVGFKHSMNTLTVE